MKARFSPALFFTYNNPGLKFRCIRLERYPKSIKTFSRSSNRTGRSGHWYNRACSRKAVQAVAASGISVKTVCVARSHRNMAHTTGGRVHMQPSACK